MICELLRRRHLLVLTIQDCFKTRLMHFFMSCKYSLDWTETSIDPLFPYPESEYLTGTLSKGFLSCPFCTSTADWLSQPVNYLELRRTPYWPQSHKVLWDHWETTVISFFSVCPEVVLFSHSSSPKYVSDSFQLCNYFNLWFRGMRFSTVFSTVFSSIWCVTFQVSAICCIFLSLNRKRLSRNLILYIPHKNVT